MRRILFCGFLILCLPAAVLAQSPAVVHFTVDVGRDNRPISRFIYGVNQMLTGAFADCTLDRLGGNRWTAYNWTNNASNAGNDYRYQNDGYLGNSNTPGAAVTAAINNAHDRDAGIILTIQMAGYVSADKKGDGDVRNSGADYLQTRFRPAKAAKNGPFTLTPDPQSPVVFEDEFVNWVVTKFPYSLTDANRPIWFMLDNEPDLWSETHAEIHPAKLTYAELVSRSIEYATAIKKVAPGAMIFGPASYGWNGYVNLQDAPDAGGRDFLSFYLEEMAKAEKSAGRRLVDALDVHWYPEAKGGDKRITENDNSPAVVAARIAATRSLWDSTYVETSWITQSLGNKPINLIPRLLEKIQRNDPDAKLSISEYNYGGGNHISGAIAEADALGIFGRLGVFSANQWPLSARQPFVGAAFQMYRNFDGKHGSFGDTSVQAQTDDVPDSSIYASTDSANPGDLVIIAINKTDHPLTAEMNIAGGKAYKQAQAFQLTSANAQPQPTAAPGITDPEKIAYTMPAYSISTIRLTAN